MDDLDLSFPPESDESEWKASFLLKIIEVRVGGGGGGGRMFMKVFSPYIISGLLDRRSGCKSLVGCMV